MSRTTGPFLWRKTCSHSVKQVPSPLNGEGWCRPPAYARPAVQSHIAPPTGRPSMAPGSLFLGRHGGVASQAVVHLSRGSLDSTSLSEAGCLSLLRTHPRYLILNRISPELTGAPGSTCDWREKCPDGVKGSLVGSTGVPESLGGGSFKTSYCAPLGFGLVNQNLG